MERLLDYFKPEKYTLDLVIDKEAKTIGGVVTVTGKAVAENVKFHAVGLSVVSVLVNGKKADFEVADGVLTLFKVPQSDLVVEIGYHGSLNENMQGAYLSTYEYDGHTETIVATQFESHYAREAFPCIDEPAAKAVFELSITTPDKDDLIIANTPEVFEKHHLGHTLRRFAKLTVLDGAFSKTFQPTPRMSTYLLAWVIGKFHGKTVTNAHGTKITTYCSLAQDVDSVDFANEIAARSLEFYDDNFGVPYPLEKLDQVALPDFEAGAMENWGLVTYRESMMLVGKTATVETKKCVSLTVAHELSHQWFGDLVTMAWWDDLWLNESFASVMEYFASDYIHPEYKIFEGFFTADCFSALVRDAYTDVQSVHQEVHDPAEIATLFDGAIVYSKGAHLMLMLVRLMGWDEFCKGLRKYFEKYKYKNTVGDDLWNALSEYAEFDVGELMHGFIDKPGYPVITTASGNNLERRFSETGSRPPVVTGAAPLGSRRNSDTLLKTPFSNYSQKRFLLDSSEMPEAEWMIPEVTEDMSGHYVLGLTDAEFEERLQNFDKLGLEEKLRLLIDRSLTARTDLADSASLLPLVEKFKDEDSASVWEIVAVIIGQLKIFVEPESAEEKKLKEFVGSLVQPKLSEIGLTTRDGDSENTLRLRAILLGLDFYAEDTDNLQKLAGMYNEDYSKLDPEIRADILDAKIYLDGSVFDEYIQAYQQVADPDIKADLRTAVTLTKDAKVLKKAVELLDKKEIVKLQDQIYLFVRLFRNSKSREMTWRWLVKNWDLLRKIMGDKSLDAYPRYTANIIRTEAEFEAWKDFFLPMRDDPALTRAIEIGEKEIAARLRLIKNDRDAVIKALG